MHLPLRVIPPPDCEARALAREAHKNFASGQPITYAAITFEVIRARGMGLTLKCHVRSCAKEESQFALTVEQDRDGLVIDPIGGDDDES